MQLILLGERCKHSTPAMVGVTLTKTAVKYSWVREPVQGYESEKKPAEGRTSASLVLRSLSEVLDTTDPSLRNEQTITNQWTLQSASSFEARDSTEQQL